MTQETLADLTGIRQTTISKLERLSPRRFTSAKIVLALARALKVDPERLRFGPDPRSRAGITRESAHRKRPRNGATA